MNLEDVLEAERRGILSALEQADLDEARKRGLVAQRESRDQSPTAQAPGQSKRPQPKPETNLVEQSGMGINEGIANLAGAPVDLMTGAINLGTSGINAIAGTDIPKIENPVGGSAHLNSMRSEVLPDTPPQTTGQRYARRVGQEVGASVIPGGVAMRGATAPMRVAGATTGSAVGAGLGGQSAREVAPESDALDFAASMIGGLSVPATSYAMTPKPKAPTLDDLQREADAGYQAVRDSGATLTPEASKRLAGDFDAALGPYPLMRETMPQADLAARQAAQTFSEPRTIAEIDKFRSRVLAPTLKSPDATTRSAGRDMQQAVDDYLDNISPADVTGTNRVNEVIDTLQSARNMKHRAYKAEELEALDTGLIDRTARKANAGTSDPVTSARMAAADILGSKSRRRGYTEVELQGLRDLADGNIGLNALRTLGQLSPTASKMTGLATGGLAAATMATTGNPMLFAVPPLGYGARKASEYATKRQLGSLAEVVRNGGRLPPREATQATRGGLAAFLAAQVAADDPRSTGAR